MSLNKQGVFEVRDYPTEAKRKRMPIRIELRLLIDGKGQAVDCVVVTSTGFPAEDETLCNTAKKRARYKPATDQAGQPIGGEAMMAGGWFAQGTEPPRSGGLPADANLTVASLPGGKKYGIVTIAQIIAADGTIERCGVIKASEIAILDSNACQLIAANVPKGPISGSDGKPIRSRRTTRVIFSVP